MKTKITIPVGGFSRPNRAPADKPADSFKKPRTGPRADSTTKPVRVQVVVEAGFNGRAIDEILRREHQDVKVDSDRAAIIERVESDQIDVVLLCSHQSGRQAMEMLTRITAANPALPVIVVTSPPTPTSGIRGAAWCRDDSATPPPVDAVLLLRSVREALTEPRVKRLIRLTGSHGEPRFIARNARWLSDDLQARYSSSLHWTPAEVPIPLRMSSGATSSSQTF